VDLGGSKKEEFHSKQNQKKNSTQKDTSSAKGREFAPFPSLPLFTLILAVFPPISLVQYYELLFKQTILILWSLFRRSFLWTRE